MRAKQRKRGWLILAAAWLVSRLVVSPCRSFCSQRPSQRHCLGRLAAPNKDPRRIKPVEEAATHEVDALTLARRQLQLALEKQASAQEQVNSAQEQVDMALEDLRTARVTGDEAKVEKAKEEVKEAKKEVKEAKEEVKEAEEKVATPSETDKPFALALDDATLDESGRMLTTEKGSFKRRNTSEIWNEKKFYVRKCYKPIADLMFEKNPPTMSLLGSSGIGKSNFVIYLIWRRFQDPELSKFPIFLHRLDRITQFKKGEEPLEVDVRTLRSAPSQALYVMDADINEEHDVSCQSLWITSARRPESPGSNTEHFKHADNCGGRFFMPPWTLEEMLDDEVMPLHGLPREIVEERFGFFGGTARLVLRKEKSETMYDKERLEAALSSADALSTLKISSDMKFISKNTHLLLKMYPKRNFSSFDVNVSSPYICQELVKRNRQERSKALWERINEGRITGIGFALFEEEFHQFMQDKAIEKFKLRARPLTVDGTGNDTVVEFNGNLQGVLISGNPKPVIEAGKYYQPESKSFPAFDSWTSEGLFQVTMAATHSINFTKKTAQETKVAVEAGKKQGGKAKFYFVVPSFQFDGGWKKVQKLDNAEMKDKIEQWVVCFEENLPK